MRKIGNPPREVADWLNIFARDNEAAAKHTINPFAIIRYQARAEAFREAIDLITRAQSELLDILQLPIEIPPSPR